MAKSFILFFLVTRTTQSHTLKRLKFYIVCALIGGIFEDFAWISILVQQNFLHLATPYDVIPKLFVRLAWVFYAIEYQMLALFIEKLTEQKQNLSYRQKLFLFLSLGFACIFALLALLNILNSQPSLYQLKLEAIFVLYSLFILMPTTLWVSIRKLKATYAPRLIKTQVLMLIQLLIIPRLVFDFIQYFPFSFIPGHFTNAYAVNGISTIILTIALFFCARRIIGLRFLNFNSHVQSPHQFNFIDDFKEILEQLSRVTTLKELGHITQTLFKEAFNIHVSRTTLFFRSGTEGKKQELSRIEIIAETYLSNTSSAVHNYLQENKIVIFDELDFSHFYETQDVSGSLLKFMESINADIFIPIYKNQTIIGYIIVERYARMDEFFSDVERDEMLVYARYLANIINLLQHRTLETLLVQEKELKEELYQKHQEIGQYKESLRSFLKNGKRDIGIIFYKSRRFIFANQAAQEIVTINLNLHEGHPLTKAFKKVAQQVEEYKSPQKIFAKDALGNKIAIAAVSNLESNTIIITVSYPDVSDILACQLDHLKDPTKWDYLLYLETTKPGQLINQLIPGSGETLLNFKIELLQLALSKKALLLEMLDEDLMPTVELLHHISMRETLHVLSLQSKSTSSDIAIKLFGVNPIFGIQNQGKPIFEKLHDNGTLFIEHIDMLDLETQEYLAEYIKYGYYRSYKSDVRIPTSIRIICSTTQSLQNLAQEGTFSFNLLQELKKTTISMPSLLTLPDHELAELAQGYTYQALKHDDFSGVLELSDKEKQRLALQRPASLAELKQRVQQLLTQKSKKNNINEVTHLDQSYDTTDPELIQAARLGRHALRDPRIMTMLWNKFKSQNKIATFLGVNRSSVNRRCKDYKLIE